MALPTDSGGSGTAPTPTPVATTTTTKKTTVPKAPPVPKVVTSKTGQVAKVATPAAVPDLNHYLGTDTIYEQTLAGQQNALAHFLAGQNTQRVQQNTGYADSKRTLGQQEDLAQGSQLDNFAGRGIAHSSIYGDALSQLLKGYTDKFNGLDQKNSNFLSGLTQAKQTFLDSQLAAKQKAMSDAAGRRAATIAAQAASPTVVKGP